VAAGLEPPNGHILDRAPGRIGRGSSKAHRIPDLNGYLRRLYRHLCNSGLAVFNGGGLLLDQGE
jgi:hypothetical protein